jgi:hypothetical protein
VKVRRAAVIRLLAVLVATTLITTTLITTPLVATPLMATPLMSTPSAAEVTVPAGQIVAVTGLNGALYVRMDGATGWTNLGGVLIEQPSVSVVPGTGGPLTHFTGIGSNGYPYQRTLTTGWRRLSPLGFRCTQLWTIPGPGSTVLGTCTAANNAVYGFSFDGSTPEPVVTEMPRLSANGQVSGRVAIEAFGAESLYLAQGPEFVTDEQTPGNHWVSWGDGRWAQTQWFSRTPMGADPTGTFEVYQRDPTTIDVVCYRATAQQYPVAGAGIGAASVVLNDDGTAQLYVTGTNRAVYTQRLSCGGAGLTGWSSVPAATVYGTTAASAVP